MQLCILSFTLILLKNEDKKNHTCNNYIIAAILL